MGQQKPDQAKIIYIQSERGRNFGGHANTFAKENGTENKKGIFIAVCAINKPESGKHVMFITS
jgi:hypothetical protein